jgi:hypothetical protein
VLFMGIEPCTTCKYGPYTAHIWSANANTVHIRPMYGHTDMDTDTVGNRKFPYTDTVIRRIQLRRILVCMVLDNPLIPDASYNLIRNRLG